MSAFSTRGLAQTDAGRAAEIWAQTLKETITGFIEPGWFDGDWLKTFHGGTVDVLSKPPEEFRWNASFGMNVWPALLPDIDLKIGANDTLVALETVAYWKERVQRLSPTDAGALDLAFYLETAARSNPGLVWKGTWAADPPDANIVKGGAGMAVDLPRIFPVNFDLWYDAAGNCQGVFASFTAVWRQERLKFA